MRKLFSKLLVLFFDEMCRLVVSVGFSLSLIFLFTFECGSEMTSTATVH